MCGLLLAVPSDASPTKDQAFEPASPDTIPTVFRELRWAQTFTVGVSGTLTRVDVLVAQQFGIQPQSLDVTIFSTSGGAPHVPITAAFHIPASSVPLVSHPSSFDSYAYLSASFSLPVTAGDVLAIVVSTGPNSQYYWAGVFGGGYPGGQLYSTNSTTWGPRGSQDQAFRTFIASSSAPTASAGSSQTVRPGTTVSLDGSGSYDDNTETSLLQYAWSVVSVPDGSAVTTLTDANTMTPRFVPDVPGNYVVRLAVTDDDGLSSLPSQVMIGENLPPIANAGRDQLLIVGQTADLNGSAVDPDGDSITFNWQLSAKPTGSNAQIAQANLANTTLLPDLPGVYVATLTPGDFVGPGTSASATITATTATGYAAVLLQTAATEVRELPATAVTVGGNQNALIQLLSNVAVALQNEELTAANKQLRQALSRTDGCANEGAPDGNGPGRDWITTCEAQEKLYPLLVAALTAIAQ